MHAIIDASNAIWDQAQRDDFLWIELEQNGRRGKLSIWRFVVVVFGVFCVCSFGT